MTNPPTISVCIAHYNGIDLIEACIASVRAQDIAETVEIIVHDDASDDGSVDFIRTQYPDVRLVQSHENVGFCVANNRMVALARGRHILLLNNDATLLPDALRTLLAEAERLVHPAILGLPQYDATTGELLDIGSVLDPFFNPVPNRDPGRNDVGMVMGACLWIDKSLWEELGGFPEWFGSIGEDLHLCCRARLAGHPVRALGTSGYGHRVGRSFGGGKVVAGQLATTFRRRALSERNKTLVLATTCPAPFMQLFLPLHLIVLLAEGSLLSLVRLDAHYLTRIYLPVFAVLLQRQREIRAERGIAMASRRIPRADFFAAFDWMPYKLRMLLRHGLPEVR